VIEPIPNLATRLNRRRFLAGSSLAVASVGALAACGSSKSNGSGQKGATTTGNDGSAGASTGFIVVNYFSDGFFTPGRQRLPIGLGDRNGVVESGGPKVLTGRVLNEQGQVVGKPVSVERHDDGVPRPYWPVQLELTEPGIYRLEMDTAGGKKADTSFSITDPAKVLIPKAGDKMKPFVTPTAAAAGGVNPICTRNPFCSLHGATLTEALQSGKPVAFLIATPAHCQKTVCGPVLDLVVEQVDRLAGKVAGVHAEVYTDDTINDVAPAVLGYDLLFEPALWLADKSGTIMQRFDVVFDRVELRAAFDALVA
jgi:hypothetical protein